MKRFITASKNARNGLDLGIKVLQSLLLILNFVTAYLISIFFPIKKTVYVIGSNYGNETDPNATGLYAYIKSLGHAVYFASNRNRASAEFTKRGSIHCCYIYLNASAAFYTHSLSDIVPHGHRLAILERFPRPILIFLQHGVIGLKRSIDKKNTLDSYLLSLEKTFDKMIVSSDREKRIVQSLGIPAGKICVTGLPRFDKLHIGHVNNHEVLVFFTWQDRTAHEKLVEQIHKSDSVKYLQAHGYTVHFAKHFMQTAGKTARTDSNLTALVRSCSLLITDNSSIAWDFLYRKAQVIFYNSADDWLIKDDCSLIKMHVNNKTELLNAVKAAVAGGEVKLDYTFSKYRDNKNCERVFKLADTAISS